jgi:cell division protein FtsQ
MDRSLAGRPAIGRVGRRFAAAAPTDHRSARGAARARRGARHLGPRAWPGQRLLSAGAGVARACMRPLWSHRRVRVAILAALLASPLLAGGWLWLRKSSLVSVQHVQISGVHGPDAGAIQAALSAAARRMTTLDVSTAALRAAVTPFRLVRDVEVAPSFPHGLRIRVIEQPPVAALTVGNARTAVAADGVALGPALLTGSLPTLTGTALPVAGERVQGASLLGALTVLGAAPAPLASALARVFTGPKGLTVAMRNGLLTYFGDAARPHAKWLSLARVLADPSSAGASYVDVRLPERPAAGFAPGTAPTSTSASGTTTSSGEQTGAESTAAALAAGLASSSGGASSSGSQAASPATAPAEATSTTPAERTPPAGGETGVGTGPEAPASTAPPGG